MGLRVFKVQGSSMAPTVNSNDFVLCWQQRKVRFKVGDLVVVDHPDLRFLVKRIVAMDSQLGVLVEGDNPASFSCHQLGWLREERLLGKIIGKT